MLYIVILAIFLVPIASIIPIKGTVVWFPQLLALTLIGGFCFASLFWKLNKFLSLFLAYLMFSYIFVTQANPRTMLCLMSGYMAISVTLIVSNLKSVKPIYIALICISALSIVYSIFQACGIDPIFLPIGGGKEDVVSFMGSHNQLGIFSVATAFISPWLIVASIVPIYFAKCNSSLFGLVAGSIIYLAFIYKFNKTSEIAFGLFCAGLLIIPWYFHCSKSSEELFERINLWSLTISQSITGNTYQEVDEDESHSEFKLIAVKANPLFGFGLGKFFEFSPKSQFPGKVFDKKYYTKGWGCPHYYEHAHNDLLEAWYETGYIGLGLVVFAIGAVVLLFAQSSKTYGVVLTFASLVGQSVCSFSVYVFHAPVSLFMFCLTLGLFYWEVNHARTSKISTTS